MASTAVRQGAPTDFAVSCFMYEGRACENSLLCRLCQTAVYLKGYNPMISRQSVPVLLALFFAIFFLALVNIFKSVALWIYALVILSMFTALVLAIRGRARDRRSFWLSLFISLALILGIGILMGLMGYLQGRVP